MFTANTGWHSQLSASKQRRRCKNAALGIAHSRGYLHLKSWRLLGNGRSLDVLCHSLANGHVLSLNGSQFARGFLMDDFLIISIWPLEALSLFLLTVWWLIQYIPSWWVPLWHYHKSLIELWFVFWCLDHISVMFDWGREGCEGRCLPNICW